MATLADLVTRVEDLIYGVARVERPKEDTLSTAVSGTTDTEWRFVTDTMWKRDDYAQPIAASEIIVLAEDHPSGADVTVRRGQRGTTAAASYAQGGVFYRNPIYTRSLIERTVNEVIDNDLWPQLWMWKENSLTFAQGDTHYELAANEEDVIQMYQINIGSTDRIDPMPNGWWRVMSQINTTASSTGKLLRLFRVYDPDATVYYSAKQKPQSSEISELSDEIVNMVPWKVAGKLMAGRAIQQRSAPSRSPQSNSREGDRLLRDYTFLDVEFRRMKKDEENRLKTLMKDWQPRYIRYRRVRG